MTDEGETLINLRVHIPDDHPDSVKPEYINGGRGTVKSYFVAIGHLGGKMIEKLKSFFRKMDPHLLTNNFQKLIIRHKRSRLDHLYDEPIGPTIPPETPHLPDDLFAHPSEGWVARTDHQIMWELVARGVYRIPIPDGWIVRVSLIREHVFKIRDPYHMWGRDGGNVPYDVYYHYTVESREDTR